MTSCATCEVVRQPYVFGLRLRLAVQDPQLRSSKVVELDRPTAYPPQECHPFLPVAFANRRGLPLLSRQNRKGPALLQKALRSQPRAYFLRRYWKVWPGNLRMLQAPVSYYF